MSAQPVRAIRHGSLPLGLIVAIGALGSVLLVQVLPTVVALSIAPAVAVGLAILRYPWIAGLLLVISVPVQQIGAAGPLTLTRACLALSLGALVIWFVAEQRQIVFDRGLLPMFVLLLTMAMSAHVSRDIGAAFADIVRWTIAAIALFAFLQFFASGSEQRALLLAGAVAAAAALESLFGMVQSLRAVGPASFVVGGGLTRAFGTFGRPNTFAGFLEFGVFLGFSLGVLFGLRALQQLRSYRIYRLSGFHIATASRKRFLVRAACAGGFLGSAALALFGILASFSRGAWLGVLAGSLCLVLLISARLRWIIFLTAPLLLVIVFANPGGLLPATIEERVGSITDVARPFDAASVTITDENFAAAERMAHWQAGWHMFEDHPMLGVGAGNFNERYPDYFVREEFRFSQGHAHNFYIHILAENGIIGFLAYMTLLGYFGVLALRICLFAPHSTARYLALGALATLVSVSVHSFFENLHVLNLSIMYSAIGCLIVAAHRLWRGTGTSEPRDARTNMEYSGA